MDWLNGLAERVARDVPLAERTWFRLGGQARYFLAPTDESELAEGLRAADEAGIAVRVLGGGANLLVRDDGFDGLVIALDRGAFRKVRIDEGVVRAGAGVDLMKLCRDCTLQGLGGLETLAGIPGTVGGAIAMNAGGRFGQIADTVQSVRLMERDGRAVELSAEAMGFGYRCSAVGQRVVLEATFALTPEHPGVIKRRFRKYWTYKRTTQPMAAHSAGCCFKNPPQAPAGQLIEEAGLKGTTFGQARVSDRHANFIVADDGATSADVLALVELVRARVEKQTGIRLETEITVW